MRIKMSGVARLLVMAIMAVGFFAVATTSVSAQQYECVNEPGLELLDPTKGDNVLTLSDLQSIAAQFPNNARLQELVAQAQSEGLAGIQYANCGTTPQPTQAPGGTNPTPAPTQAPGGDGTGADTDTGGDDTDGGDTDAGTGGEVVAELPETGAGTANNADNMNALLLGAGSVLVLAGTVVWRKTEKR